MAEEPDNLTLRLLREMREILDKHTRMHEQHSSDLKSVRQSIYDWQETTATATGFSVHANLRSQDLEHRVDDLARRIEALEKTQ